MESTNEIALSDFSFFSRVIITLVWLLKSSVVFFIFFVLIPLKYFLASVSREYYLLVLIGMIMAYSLIFLIYYVVSEGILKEMFFGFILTIIGAIVAFFHSACRCDYCYHRNNIDDTENNIRSKNDTYVASWCIICSFAVFRRTVYV